MKKKNDLRIRSLLYNQSLLVLFKYGTRCLRPFFLLSDASIGEMGSLRFLKRNVCNVIISEVTVFCEV
jgi:hypothetical protein